MKILVTGAGGNLGRVVLPALADAGHTVRALDFRPLERGVADEVVEADLRDAEEATRAVAGVDAIVHGAALHGVHLRDWSPHEYWSTNVTATFNVYEAARTEGVGKVVLSSTMAVYGESAERTEDAWAVVTEELPPRPKDVYGLSKWLCEDMASYYARTAAISTVSLRLGMFVPESFERYGFRLLFGGVDDRDVAQAVLLALEHEPEGGFDVFDIMARTPFAAGEAAELARDPAAVLERHWPGCGELVRERGLALDELVWGWAIWPVDKAERGLAYRPAYNFGEFLEALRRDDRAHYPFAGLPQWGLAAGGS